MMRSTVNLQRLPHIKNNKSLLNGIMGGSQRIQYSREIKVGSGGGRPEVK